LLIYFLSFSFLNSVKSLTLELNKLIQRVPTHSFLLLMEK